MVWRRALLITLLTITGLAVETSVLDRITLLGTRPELVLLIVVALAMGEGPEIGAIAGFVMGLMTDLVLLLPVGVTALTFTLVGFAVGAIRAQLQTPSAWLPMAMIFFATLAAVTFYGSFLYLLGQDTIGFVRIARHAVLAALYNALLTPFVFPLVRALGARLRPAGVIS